MWSRLAFRPQLFTTAFLAFQLWLLASINTGRRSWRWLWVLPPIYALWINLHGGWVQGLALLGAIGGALVLMEIRRGHHGRRVSRQQWRARQRSPMNLSRDPTKFSEPVVTGHLPLRHLALVLGACGLALLINPYSWDLIEFPLTMQTEWIRAQGPEWQSPFLNVDWDALGQKLIVPLPAGFYIYQSVEPVFYVYLIILGGVLLATVRRWRTADLVSTAVMGLWLLLCVRHLRTAADGVLLTAPFVAAALTSFKGQMCRLIPDSMWP